MKTPKRVYYDTWAYVALADRSNQSAHSAAAQVNRRLLEEKYSPVTTNYVVDETLTLVKRRLGHQAASTFLDDLEAGIESELIELQWITPDREKEAKRLFTRYSDKPRLSFTDCTNLAIMKELGIVLIFTADSDFETADPKNYPFRCLIHERKGRYFAEP